MPAQYLLYALIFLLPSAGLGLWWFVKKRQQKNSPLNSAQAQEKSLEVLHDAIKKSQDMLSSAQLEEIKAVTEANITSKSFEQQLEKEFAGTSREAQEKIRQAEATYLQFLEGLKAKALQDQENNQALIIKHINDLFEAFEQNLANFLTTSQQHSVQSIELELRAARQMISTYQQQQLKLVDENVIAILERTLSIVLTKKLTLKDQVDLVYEALDKAKKENFIA